MAYRGFSAPRQGTHQFYLYFDIDDTYFNDIVIREIERERGSFIVLKISLILFPF